MRGKIQLIPYLNVIFRPLNLNSLFKVLIPYLNEALITQQHLRSTGTVDSDHPRTKQVGLHKLYSLRHFFKACSMGMAQSLYSRRNLGDSTDNMSISNLLARSGCT